MEDEIKKPLLGKKTILKFIDLFSMCISTIALFFANDTTAKILCLALLYMSTRTFIKEFAYPYN